MAEICILKIDMMQFFVPRVVRFG